MTHTQQIEKKTIARNAGVLMAADIVTLILQAVLTLVIARKLGAESLGLLAFAISLSMLFNIFTEFGFRNLITRDIAKQPDKASGYFLNIAAIKIVLSLLIISVVFSILYLTQAGGGKIRIVMIVMGIMIVESYINFINAFFRAWHQAHFAALLKTLMIVFTVSISLCLLLNGYGLLPYLMVKLMVFGMTAMFGTHLFFRRIPRVQFNVSFSECRRLIAASIPFALLGVIVIVNSHFGTLLLSLIRGDSATGYYAAAQRLTGFFGFIPVSLVGAVLPAMAAFYHQEKQDKLLMTYQGLQKSLMLLILPVAVGMTLLAGPIVELLYGNEFKSSILLLQIFIWFQVFSFANHGLMSAFTTINEEKRFVRIQFMGMAVNIVLNLILIPFWGAAGVCISAVASQILINGIASYQIRKRLFKIPKTDIILKPLSAALIMGGALWFSKGVSIFIQVPVAMVVYGCVLLLMRAITMKEINLLTDMVRKKTKAAE